jgi:hypothetical protein
MAAVNPSGLLLVLAGTWILCQVLAGRALYRLKILESAK